VGHLVQRVNNLEKQISETQTSVGMKPTTWKFAVQYSNHCTIAISCWTQREKIP